MLLAALPAWAQRVQFPTMVAQQPGSALPAAPRRWAGELRPALAADRCRSALRRVSRSASPPAGAGPSTFSPSTPAM